MTTDEARAIRNEMANFAHGLDILIEAFAATTAIVTAIHVELCKDPPPSKIPAALAELTDAVRSLEASILRRG